MSPVLSTSFMRAAISSSFNGLSYRRSAASPTHGDAADELGKRLAPEALYGSVGGHDGRCGPVGDPGCGGGGHGAGIRVATVLAARQVERRLEPGEGFGAGVPPRAFVRIDDGLAPL